MKQFILFIGKSDANRGVKEKMLLNNEVRVLVAVKQLRRADKFVISRKLAISTGWAHEMLNNLVLKGYLERVVSPTNCEVYELSPLEKEASDLERISLTGR